ncbi:GEVED domain-containing protein [Winogradskyella sp. PG-2]|uniref:GEVED domain-containing protein n=1 Tax=Winogradskyella sp. PG-2 TaxID=754409 RepID=UPI0004588357|nr:GEVED domain-containing protein [Winogradskyella sp. PG-2]BAO77676.1 hypothetical protein WPG_3446 [Winogradskyella sp. PG-2]
MKKTFLFLLLGIISLYSFGQTVIYSESFDGQTGQGATGSTPTIDLSAVDWDIDVSGASSNSNYRFHVRTVGGNPIFESRRVGTSIWLSPSIDISAHTDISFTIDATQGRNNLDDTDTLTTQYRIDSGSWTNASINGALSNDYGSVVISESALNGSTSLEIRIISVNNANNERHRIDNIEVTGTIECYIPVNPITFNATNSSTTSIDLDWDLNDCNDEYLIIAKEASAVTALPTGNGGLYTADSNFGNGTEIVTNEFVVYKGDLTIETISNLIFGNTYHFTIFSRKGTTWSSGTQINFTISYCTSVGTRTDYDTNTTLVSFGEINNNTVGDDGAPYHDYTAFSNNIELGATEDLTVNIDTDGNFSVYCYVWIDWNRDGDFEDAGEIYDLGSAANTENGPTSNSALSITAPTDAELGDTRMRVVSEYYYETIPTNGPCDGAADGEVEDYTVTILPAIEYTYDNGWLPSDPNGVATFVNDITIMEGTANFNTTTNCHNITVNPEGSLMVASGVTLSIDGEMTLKSSSTRYSSLISDGTITGDVVYKRHVNNAAGNGTTTTANDLLSAPLTDQTFGAFRAANPNILSGTIGGGSTLFLFGPFNPATESYVNYSSSDDTSTLSPGSGYRTGSTDGATYTFTGTIETGNVDTPVVSGGSSNWNLIGNPYPSYLKVQDFLNNSSNAALLDENAVGMYGYDGTATDGWVVYNLATTTASTVITPGQGFFVDAESSGNIQFTPGMRSTGTDDDFIAGRNSNPLVFVKLNVSNATKNYNTDFYFNDNATLSLDVGYDAKIWNNTPPSFSVYSHLVENNTGDAMAIQALHSDDLLNVTIPLGVNANNDSDIVFTISESTLPESINVYIEDTVEDTLTLLTEEDYIMTPNASISGTGRFYLRLVANQLNVKEQELEMLNIFTDNNRKSVEIAGLIQEHTSFQLFDVQGREVVSKGLQLQTNRQSIGISHLASGIYVVKLHSEASTKTQKIILR